MLCIKTFKNLHNPKQTLKEKHTDTTPRFNSRILHACNSFCS